MNNTKNNTNIKSENNQKEPSPRNQTGKQPQPGGKDRSPNSKVGPGQGRSNRSYFRR